MRLPFGKYCGCELADDTVPSESLRWLAMRSWIYANLQEAISAELDRRDRRDASRETTALLRPEERRLIDADWKRSDLGYWSRWFHDSRRAPGGGWAVYMATPRCAAAIPAYLDAVKSQRQQRQREDGGLMYIVSISGVDQRWRSEACTIARDAVKLLWGAVGFESDPSSTAPFFFQQGSPKDLICKNSSRPAIRLRMMA
jgi:hypothetical protein